MNKYGAIENFPPEIIAGTRREHALLFKTLATLRTDAALFKNVDELRWRGPFEIEMMLDESSGEYVLIEINPRFPAWVDFPAIFGANFAAALVEMIAMGEPPKSFPECPAGHFYLRHQIEVHGHIDQLAALSTSVDFAPAHA